MLAGNGPNRAFSQAARPRDHSYDSPIGPLTVCVNKAGAVTAVKFLQAAGSPLGSVHPILADSLDRYFAGGEGLEKVPVELEVSAFQGIVLAALRSIPCGQTRSYAEIARSLGRPAAWRAVGGACAGNPIPIIIPCHRVLGSSGLGGYQKGLAAKLYLLQLERCSFAASPKAGPDRLSHMGRSSI